MSGLFDIVVNPSAALAGVAPASRYENVFDLSAPDPTLLLLPPVAPGSASLSQIFNPEELGVSAPAPSLGCHLVQPCFVQMTSDEYHADFSAISSSGLKEILRSPAHLKASRDAMVAELMAKQKGDDTESKKKSAALAFGTALHMAVLEPDLYANEYVVVDGAKNTKKYKDEVALLPGKSIISSDEKNVIDGMAAAIKSYQGGILAESLQLSDKEQSIYFTDEETGVRCKIRADFLVRGVAGFDLKSTTDARPEQFLRSAMRDYHYDLSAALYIEGIEQVTGKPLPFYIVAIEKEAPFGMWVYEIKKDPNDRFYMNGLKKMRRALRLYKGCMEKNEWPCYADNFAGSGFDVPKYMLDKGDDFAQPNFLSN